MRYCQRRTARASGESRATPSRRGWRARPARASPPCRDGGTPAMNDTALAVIALDQIYQFARQELDPCDACGRAVVRGDRGSHADAHAGPPEVRASRAGQPRDVAPGSLRDCGRPRSRLLWHSRITCGAAWPQQVTDPRPQATDVTSLSPDNALALDLHRGLVDEFGRVGSGRSDGQGVSR